MLSYGLGRCLELNPEIEIGRQKIGERLMWDVIGSNVMVTCRVGRWAYKTSNIIRVWLIERLDLLREAEREVRSSRRGFPKEKIMDVIVYEYVSCDKLIVYVVANLNRFTGELNRLLRDVGLGEVNLSEAYMMLYKSMLLVDRVGDSESISTTIKASFIKTLKTVREGLLTTMTPINWIEVDELNTNIRLDMPTTPLLEGRRIRIYEERTREMILPLKPVFGKILYYINSPYKARAKDGYTLLVMENEDSIVVPEDFLKVEKT